MQNLPPALPSITAASCVVSSTSRSQLHVDYLHITSAFDSVNRFTALCKALYVAKESRHPNFIRWSSPVASLGWSGRSCHGLTWPIGRDPPDRCPAWKHQRVNQTQPEFRLHRTSCRDLGIYILDPAVFCSVLPSTESLNACFLTRAFPLDVCRHCQT